MAVYLCFTSYSNTLLATDEPPAIARVVNPFTGASIPSTNLVTVQSAGLGGDQVLNIGSQSTGAGAGKVTFEPLIVSRVADSLSQVFFLMMCSGTAWQYLDVFLTSPADTAAVPRVYEAYRLGLAAVDHMERALDGSGTTIEKVSFEYGGVLYGFADPRGTTGRSYPFVYSGWDRVKNVKWDGSPIS